MLSTKIKTACSIFTVMASTLIIGCTATKHQESTGEFIDSSAITATVKTHLLADKSIRSLPITVKTYKNVVQLSGFVDNYYQKGRAAEIASQVKGVKYVQNALTVKPS